MESTLRASVFTLRAFAGIVFYLAGICGRCEHVLGRPHENSARNIRIYHALLHLPGHLPGSAEPEQLRVGLGLSGPSPLGSPSSSVETLPIFF